MNQEKVTGMVLSAAPIGDYDKRLVILTREFGRIAAFAKGARRPNSPLLACSEPFTFGEFLVYQGRNSYTVAGAEITNYFQELRGNLEGAWYGFYFCEFADHLSRENVDGTDFLKLLYQTFRILIKQTIPYRLVRRIFELKLISLNGEAPQIFECTHCGRKEFPMQYSMQRRGVFCRDCQGQLRDGILLEDTLLYTMQYIIATPVEKLYTFTVNQEVLAGLESFCRKYIAVCVDHTFKSLEILNCYESLQ